MYKCYLPYLLASKKQEYVSDSFLYSAQHLTERRLNKNLLNKYMVVTVNIKD